MTNTGFGHQCERALPAPDVADLGDECPETYQHIHPGGDGFSFARGGGFDSVSDMWATFDTHYPHHSYSADRSGVPATSDSQWVRWQHYGWSLTEPARAGHPWLVDVVANDDSGVFIHQFDTYEDANRFLGDFQSACAYRDDIETWRMNHGVPGDPSVGLTSPEAIRQAVALLDTAQQAHHRRDLTPTWATTALGQDPSSETTWGLARPAALATALRDPQVRDAVMAQFAHGTDRDRTRILAHLRDAASRLPDDPRITALLSTADDCQQAAGHTGERPEPRWMARRANRITPDTVPGMDEPPHDTPEARLRALKTRHTRPPRPDTGT